MPIPSHTSARTPPSGAGIGLRPVHHEEVMRERPSVAWFEVHAENFMRGGLLGEDLDRIAGAYPLSLHAVGLSLGSAGGLDGAHIDALRMLCHRYDPVLVSDHLSWSRVEDTHWPDLLPLPYTEEALDVVAANVARVQDALGRQLLVENPSAYVGFADTDMSEAQFLAELVARTRCGLLLDVNNIYVSGSNLGRDPAQDLRDIIDRAGSDAIREIHIAGHAASQTRSGAAILIDDHGDHVCEGVWALLDIALEKLGPRSTLIEWDTNIPKFNVLMAEAARAETHLRKARQPSKAHAAR